MELPRAVCLVVLAALFASPLLHADSLRRGPSDKGNIATSFKPWGSLTEKQRDLIHDGYPAVRDDASFQQWASENEDFAGTFLANTHALERLMITFGPGTPPRPFIDLLRGMDHLEGDRIKVYLDSKLFGEWRSTGSNFIIKQANGDEEKGSFHFDGGDVGGSLHSGYDIQGYTSVRKAPRIQIQYRIRDSGSDIDIDYIAPWAGGIIPNPSHLTWGNSDVRDHLDGYIGKFGEPGFSVDRAGN